PQAAAVVLWCYVGAVVGVMLVIASVAAGRDRAEARLSASEGLYRSLVEDSAAMICRLGPDGVVTFANETYLRAYRTTAREVVDRVRQLLAYAGKGPLAARLLDLNAVVKDTADLVAVSVPKRCQILFDPAAGLPAVEADEVQLRQVVTNLIINAAEAIGESNG